MSHRQRSSRAMRVLAGALAKVLFLGLFATTACSVITPSELAAGIGQSCRTNSDCNGGLCTSLQRFPDSGICTLRCSTKSDCPAPSECTNNECHVPLSIGTTLTGSPNELEGWTYAHVQGLESAQQALERYFDRSSRRTVAALDLQGRVVDAEALVEAVVEAVDEGVVVGVTLAIAWAAS